MGGCTSEERAVITPQSKKIDSEMKALATDIHQTIKILLLGPGESGKSTVFKQMKIIQDGGGFTEEEKLSFQEQIFNNCVSQMRAIIEAAINLKIPLTKKESLENAGHLMKATRDVVIWTPELGNMIKELWEDPGIQEVYKKRGQHYQLNDTTEYFMSNIDRINAQNFIPTEEDVLRVRVRSTGIEEAEFTFDKKVFKVIDVGGQRSERRKWIHCFDGVSAVLFCASLADYDLPLREDPRQNRLKEAISLFSEVCNSETFISRTLIFFLNKTDLLKLKLPEHPLEKWIDTYAPPQSQDPEVNYKAASEFLKDLFLSEVDTNRRNMNSLFSHFTCALDTKNIEVVIRAVRTTLLKDIITSVGL